MPTLKDFNLNAEIYYKYYQLTKKESKMKNILLLAIKNWKTTSAGIGAVLIWILDEVFKFGLTAEQKSFITSMLMGLGLFFSKDSNVSGSN